ncbi:cytochrome P450 [Melanomma pulvis-pyrius CBS 109.77]|uniref:Cytochrome P450 n=1 Tax=Melanomma pulvis-pyrius CBS 109.77 TaxID=1314802 RepID=A0A6A6WR38_9PLEO|nr:cytochrome P450 [Melanomma pulvis-pyrius CBS 109.77]
MVEHFPESLSITPSTRKRFLNGVRLFIFSGYDSTGSVICYCFHFLSKHPKVLARLRAEHDEVLSSDPASAASTLSGDPRLVNNLPYTLAVIKEVLRMFPPAGTTRAGKPNLYPKTEAWRPFENGPRNYIGQALVLVELRVVLACLIRTFNISPAYDEWDAKHPINGIKLYRGERAYQVEAGAAHPAAQYPCRVTLAKREE